MWRVQLAFTKRAWRCYRQHTAVRLPARMTCCPCWRSRTFHATDFRSLLVSERERDRDRDGAWSAIGRICRPREVGHELLSCLRRVPNEPWNGLSPNLIELVDQARNQRSQRTTVRCHDCPERLARQSRCECGFGQGGYRDRGDAEQPEAFRLKKTRWTRWKATSACRPRSRPHALAVVGARLALARLLDRIGGPVPWLLRAARFDEAG